MHRPVSGLESVSLVYLSVLGPIPHCLNYCSFLVTPAVGGGVPFLSFSLRSTWAGLQPVLFSACFRIGLCWGRLENPRSCPRAVLGEDPSRGPGPALPPDSLLLAALAGIRAAQEVLSNSFAEKSTRDVPELGSLPPATCPVAPPLSLPVVLVILPRGVQLLSVFCSCLPRT